MFSIVCKVFFFNAANCYWASKSATTMFRALPGIMSLPTASVFPGSSFSVSFFLPTAMVPRKFWYLTLFLSSGMNVDRLYAIRRPLAYVNAVCMKMSIAITTIAITTIKTTQARLNEYSVPKMILICCLVSKQESQLQANSTFSVKITGCWRTKQFRPFQVAVIPPIPLLFDPINMEGMEKDDCDCMIPIQNVIPIQIQIP